MPALPVLSGLGMLPNPPGPPPDEPPPRSVPRPPMTYGVLPTRTPDVPLDFAAMKMSDLRKQATLAGIDRQSIERAIDSEVPKEALVEMIVQRHAMHSQTIAGTMEGELRSLRQSELEVQAQTEGVAARALEAAIDDPNPKDAIIRLLLERRAQVASVSGQPAVHVPAPVSPQGPVCPFCMNRGLSSRALSPPAAGGRTRQRRELKHDRKTPKWGRWWRQFGYNGPKCATYHVLPAPARPQTP